MILNEAYIEEFKASVSQNPPHYIKDFDRQWPDILACLQNIDQNVVSEGTAMILLAMVVGGSRMEGFYHLCLDGFVYGYELSCGQSPSDTLILNYTPDLAVLSHVSVSKLKHAVNLELFLVTLEVSAILRGYFAALEQVPDGGQ